MNETTGLSRSINQTIKVMITEKDKLFGGWSIPLARKAGRRLGFDMKVNFKYGTTYVNPRFVKTKLAGMHIDPLRGAFRLVENEKPFVVFDPVQGVPFYFFKRTGNASYSLQNADLVLQLADKFGYTKESVTTDFELVPFERLNGMMYFQIVVVKKVD